MLPSSIIVRRLRSRLPRGRCLEESRSSSGAATFVRRCQSVFLYYQRPENSAAKIVTEHANQRCQQENLIEQHKNGVHSLKAPLGQPRKQLGLHGDRVAGLEPQSLGGAAGCRAVVATKNNASKKNDQLLRMEFPTFCQAMINIPAQIIRSGRRLIYRLLSWNQWQEVFFRLYDQLRHPLRC